MCGICGEITLDGSVPEEDSVKRMMEVMEARGPDSSGMIFQGRTRLGHRRLKIIDLSEASKQPMVDHDLGLSVVYNGAIYNYRQLREELEAKGLKFFLKATLRLF